MVTVVRPIILSTRAPFNYGQLLPDVLTYGARNGRIALVGLSY